MAVTKQTAAEKRAATLAAKRAAAKVPKQAEAAETVEKVETTQEAPAKTVRAKKVEIDRNEMIPCRSLVDGELIYVSGRSGARYLWSEFGVTEFIDMGELLTMKSSQPKFLNDVWLVVDDEEAASALGLTKVYETVFEADDLDSFFEKSKADLAEILPKLPKGLKVTIGTRARKMVEDGVLEDLGRIKTIEEKLNIDLKFFVE